MLTAVDNYSKWVWTKVVISGSTKNRIKLLEGITELNGVPKSLMVDNSSAFESTELKNFLAESEKCVKYSTPYVYTPIELVERTIRTIEEYIKTFPVEENVLKKAVKRATRVTRFSWSAGTKRTAFHLFFNSKRGAKLINTIDLENKPNDVLKNVYDAQGTTRHRSTIHRTISETWQTRK